MAEQRPDWCEAFLQAHGLPAEYLCSAQKWFNPVVREIAEHQSGAPRPLLVGLNGSQGSGKSTLCAYLAASLAADHGCNAAVLSLDDFYLTRAERTRLADTVHPLLRTRGVPGTHDIQLLRATLQALLAGGAVSIPRFDKARDDRKPEPEWDRVAAGIDVVLLEGWCLGARAQDPAQLVRPVNKLEAEEDADGRWRDHVNEALRRDYPPLYDMVDSWVMLRAPSFDCVYGWRLEQEKKLAAQRSGDGVMNEAAIARFIQHYQRLTEHCLHTLPPGVNHLFLLDKGRAVQSYTYTAGVRV